MLSYPYAPDGLILPELPLGILGLWPLGGWLPEDVFWLAPEGNFCVLLVGGCCEDILFLEDGRTMLLERPFSPCSPDV